MLGIAHRVSANPDSQSISGSNSSSVNVIQKGVAAVQVTGDAARLDVPGDAFGGVEIETPSSVGPARKRRDRKDAGELLRINRTTQHQQRISRNALDCSACND